MPPSASSRRRPSTASFTGGTSATSSRSQPSPARSGSRHATRPPSPSSSPPTRRRSTTWWYAGSRARTWKRWGPSPKRRHPERPSGLFRELFDRYLLGSTARAEEHIGLALERGLQLGRCQHSAAGLTILPKRLDALVLLEIHGRPV